MKTIYQALESAGVKTDNHESDLYFKRCNESDRVLSEFVGTDGKEPTVSYFQSQLDGKMWGEIPFAFDPWWAARADK